MIDEMTIDKEKIRAAAMAATPGPWMRLFGERTVYDRMEDGCRGGAIARADTCFTEQDTKNLDHIATSNPSTVLSLLDALDKAEKDRAELLLTVSKIEYSMSQATIHGNDKYREIYLSKDLAEQAIKSVKGGE